MCSRALILTLIMWNSHSFAAPGSEMATSGSGTQFILDNRVFQPSEGQRLAQPAPPIRVGPAPGSAPAPGSGPARSAAPRCVPNRPYKESTPLKFHVDQINQTMTVSSPDFPPGQTLTFKVSTGGGVTTRSGNLVTNAKIPDPKSKEPPYCPETKAIVAPKLITSFEKHEFEGRRDCTEEEVRGRTTVFPGNTYTSTQFKALMPNALRFRGGEFFHRCPSGETCKAIGQPNSGQCVRVPGWQKPPDWMSQAIREGRMNASAVAFANNSYRTEDGRGYRRQEIEVSETLAKQALKYGAYEVTMSDPPPMRQRGEPASKYPYPTRIYCDEKDVEIAKIIQARGIEPDDGWDAPDFGRMFGDFLGGIFGGGSQQRPQRERVEQPARPETPEEKKARQRRERQEQREREQWQRRVFDNT